MKREIKIFKSFEEQEEYFNNYFYNLTPSQRLKALNNIQVFNKQNLSEKLPGKITIRKHFANGY